MQSSRKLRVSGLLQCKASGLSSKPFPPHRAVPRQGAPPGARDQSEGPWNYPHPRRRPAHNRRPETDAAGLKRHQMNGPLGPRGAREQASAPEENAGGRARGQEGRRRRRRGWGGGRESWRGGGPTPPRSERGGATPGPRGSGASSSRTRGPAPGGSAAG